MKNLINKTRLVMEAAFLLCVFLSPALSEAKKALQSRPRKPSQVVLSCAVLPPITKMMLDQHITHSQFVDMLKTRTTEEYIKIMDGFKFYFLESDVRRIRQLMTNFYAQLPRRKCANLQIIQNLHLQRANERFAFAQSFLGERYKFDSKVKIVLDPKKRKYPKTKAEAERLMRQHIHYQVAGFRTSDMEVSEARKRVLDRYKQMLARIKEKKEPDFYVDFLNAFANSLDPHSAFLSLEDWEELLIAMSLSLEGIGASLSSQYGYTIVEQLINGGSAKSSGLIKEKDKIIAVAQGERGSFQTVIDMPLNKVVRLIRGPEGTKVRLKMLREKDKGNETLIVTLVRRKVSLEISAAKIHYVEQKVQGKIRTVGVLELPSFYQDTQKKEGRSSSRDLKQLLQEASRRRIDGLVFDLSSNGGGALDESVKIAGLFFKKGAVVQYGRPDRGMETLKDENPDVNYTGPCAVLTNRFSASASEIVAGALKDYRRCVVIGADHTFGKGNVQQLFPPRHIGGLGAFKITTSFYFIPGGNSTQHRGVTSDIILPSIFAKEDIGEKYADYSLPPKSVKTFLSKEAYVTKGRGAWKPITLQTLSTLRARSKVRVQQSEKFEEIRGDIKKNQEQEDVVDVAQMLKRVRDKKAKEGKKDEGSPTQQAKKTKEEEEKERNKKYLESAYIAEATQVVLDLMQLQNGELLHPIGKSQGAKARTKKRK